MIMGCDCQNGQVSGPGNKGTFIQLRVRQCVGHMDSKPCDKKQAGWKCSSAPNGTTYLNDRSWSCPEGRFKSALRIRDHLARLIVGGWWTLNFLLGNDLCSWTETKQRLTICGPCHRRKGSRCSPCGCFLRVKTRLQKQKCPIGRWPDLPLKTPRPLAAAVKSDPPSGL